MCDHYKTFAHMFLPLKAVVIPLQGFVNAVIFGWSRPTFLSGLSERLRRPPPIIPQRQASLRRSYSPVSSGSVGQQYSTFPDGPPEQWLLPLITTVYVLLPPVPTWPLLLCSVIARHSVVACACVVLASSGYEAPYSGLITWPGSYILYPVTRPHERRSGK